MSSQGRAIASADSGRVPAAGGCRALRPPADYQRKNRYGSSHSSGVSR